jgi:hypothetical protein
LRCDDELQVSGTEGRQGGDRGGQESSGLRRAAKLIQRVEQARVRRRRQNAARLLSWTAWRRRRGVYAPLQRPIPRCRWGTRLAADAEFDEQRQKAVKVLDFYKGYAAIFTKLNRGAPCKVGDGMCGEGGVSAGIVRLGCQPVGMDLEYMERYVAKFGERAFVRGSVLSGRLQERLGGSILCGLPPRARRARRWHTLEAG